MAEYEKFLKDVEYRIKNYLNEGIIQKGKKEFVPFFMHNSENSIKVSDILFNISSEKKLQETMKLPNFDGFLWVINSAYYSMFYGARALLENEGIKLKTSLSIHSITFDALVYYFYLTGKLQRSVINDFEDSQADSLELLGKERSKEVIDNYLYEKRKRAKFTYQIGEVALESKAKTSLDRAKRFNIEIRKLLVIR